MKFSIDRGDGFDAQYGLRVGSYTLVLWVAHTHYIITLWKKECLLQKKQCGVQIKR